MVLQTEYGINRLNTLSMHAFIPITIQGCLLMVSIHPVTDYVHKDMPSSIITCVQGKQPECVIVQQKVT
jgi:hypothetical protein